MSSTASTDQRTVSRVVLGSSAFFACLCHAFSTEREEIMGLLLGEWIKVSDHSELYEVHVHDLFITPRSDRRKDRVEIPPEQLAEATEAAEALAINVVGWYHSHPKITVQPSHVDVRTQAGYQGFDSLFVGLIFAVFYRDNDLLNRVQVMAFQSNITATPMVQTYTPLVISNTPTLTNNSSGPLHLLHKLPRVLFDEERATYDTSLEAMLQLNTSDLQRQLVAMHHGAVYTKALTNLIDKLCGPLLHVLELRERHLDAEIAQLERQKADLHVKQRLLL